MQAIIGGPWTLKTETHPITGDASSHWSPPPHHTRGTLDLSDTSQQSEATDQQARGNGLWEVEVDSLSDIGSDYTICASDSTPSQAQMDGAQRSAFGALFNVTLPGDVDTIESAYKRVLLELSDPTGQGTKPLFPTKVNGQYQLDINFGSHKSRERFVRGHSHITKWIPAVHGKIRETLATTGKRQAQKYLGWLFREIKQDTGILPQADMTTLIPADLRGEIKDEPPSTTVNDDWTTLDDWTTSSGSFTNSTPELTSTGSGKDVLVCDTVFSSPDMTVGAALSQNVSNGRHGLILRVTGTTYYVFFTDTSASGGIYVYKYISDSGTLLDSHALGATGLNSSDRYMRFDVNGSSLSVEQSDTTVLTSEASPDHNVASTELLTATDTAITGPNQVGMFGFWSNVAGGDQKFGPVRATDGVSGGGSTMSGGMGIGIGFSL